MKRIAILFPGLAMLGLIGLSACATQRPAGTAEGGNHVEIVATEMRFNPNRIDARVGQPVRITIVNKGNERHDLAFSAIGMPDLRGVETLTMPGQTTRLTMTFDRPGTHPFLCTIPGHAASGMTGAVFVSPQVSPLSVANVPCGVLNRPLMATCGTGCWGRFEVTLSYDVSTSQWGTLRVLGPSEADGQPVAVREYPVYLRPSP